MKKQVAKILGNMAHEIKRCDSKDPALGLLIKQASQEIYQLSQERVERILFETEIEYDGDGIPIAYLSRESQKALKKKELK